MSELKNKKMPSKFSKYKRAQASEIHRCIESFVSDFTSLSTRRAYKNDLNQFLKFVEIEGDKISQPRDIEDYHFKAYRDEMLTQKQSSATINRRLVSIRAFMKWAISQKIISYNPIESIRLPKIQTESPTQAFTDSEVLAMINSPAIETYRGSLQRVSFILLFNLGLRRSELAGIKLKDISEGRRNTILSIRGKGSKTREIPLAPTVRKELSAYFETLKSYGVELQPDDFLLRSQATLNKGLNKPINGSTIYRWIKEHALRVGITRRLSPHSCRATAISHLLDTKQVPVRDVAIFAGHENVNTTQRYDKRRDNLDRSAAYEVDYQDEAS